MTTSLNTKLGAKGNEVTANVNLTGGIEILLPGGQALKTDAMRQSSGYHFHGVAKKQCNSDLKFLDLSGALNDGVFQTHLDAATAWATAGFLSQPNPSVSGNLSLITIPPLQFDYLSGDNLFFFWRGRATPEASDQPLLGDTSGTSVGNGIKVVVTASGKLKVNAYQQTGAVSRFGGTGTSTVFEASKTHSFAFAVDGAAGKLCYWSDGVRDATYASGFLAWNGAKIDTLNAATLKLGGDGSASGGVQLGVACQHDALVILKGRRTVGIPSVAALDALVSQLHRNPAALVTAEAW